MTVSHSYLVIVPTHPGRAGSRSVVLRGCPVAEPAVPPRFVTACFGIAAAAAQSPRCCRLYGSAPSLVRLRVCRCLPGLAGVARFAVVIFAVTWLARFV
jgi:hypothetical protein